ncbi:MAG: FtsW/RodA/SpoVE family cell cycle protein [Cellulosilyticaceae bacterium]
MMFFHLGGSSILVAKAADNMMKQQILVNSIVVFLIITIATLILRICKRQQQLVMWNIVFFLLDISYITLQRLDHELATRQIAWMIVSVLLAITLPWIGFKLLAPKYKYLYLGITVITMVLPFIFGDARNGAMNWVQIGSFSFQPSEIGKVTMILFLAGLFDSWGEKKEKLKILIIAGVSMGGVLGCLVLQRDLGGALLYYLTFLVMLFIGTQKFWLPLLGLGGGALASVAGYMLFSHVRVRVEAWLNPWADISGGGYQVVQGLFAMGTWGWFGSGLTRGIPTKIPFVTTDYIFAAIAEEFGNLFAIVVILCYLAIILQGLKIALMQKERFQLFVCIGIVALLGFQVFIILGGVLKIIPLTGITVPFVSYGGTSLLVSVGMIGILGILAYKAKYPKRGLHNE